MNVTVTQILRPIKLAFLISPNRRSSYVRALQVASSLWGGQHFPIIPFYKKFTKEFAEEYHLFGETTYEFYKNTLDNFNPDFFVVEDGIDINHLKSIRNNREIVAIGDVEKSIINNECEYGISIYETLQTIKEKEFTHHRTDLLKVCCPNIDLRDIYTMTLCGCISASLMETIKELRFPEQYISFPRIDRSNLDVCTGENVLNYLRLGTYQTDAFGSPLWTSEFAVFIINPEHVNDLIKIWNYRALGWNILAIPVGAANEPYYRQQIEKQQIEFHKHRRLIDRINIIPGYKISEESVDACYHQLISIKTGDHQTKYTHHWWLPRFWQKGQYLSYDRAAAIQLRSEQQKTIVNPSTDDLKIHVPVLRPVFKERYVRHIKPRYANDVFLDYEEMEGRYAQILPELPTRDLDYLIRGSGFGQWIFSNGVASFLGKEDDQYLSLSIAKASEVFKKWFEFYKIQIRHSSSGKLGNQLLKNIGGIYGTNFLVNPGIPPVLSHFEGGRIVLKETLYAELSKQIKKDRFRDTEQGNITAKLIDKRIIEFGAQVQCSFCNQHSFYKLNDLNEKVKCPICQNNFFVPSHKPNEIKWAYRGMGPFSRNNKADGLLCVLLTLRFFKISMHPSNITPLLSFELLKDNRVINEVDLAVFYGKDYRNSFPPDIFFCECKTEIDFKDGDLDKMKKLGQLFPGSVLTFATLKLSLSDNERDRIKKLVNYFRRGLGPRPVNPVLILTGNELLPVNTFAPLANIEHLIVHHLRFSDEINHMADITCQQYLGLASFGTIVEERLEARRKSWDEKPKPKEQFEDNDNEP